MTNQNERILIEKIRDSYSPKQKELSPIEELKSLDHKVKDPALLFAYVFGIIGVLVFGVGMCFGLDVLIENMLWLGIVVGVVGALMMAITYPVYKKILAKRKAKYSEIIIEKSNELLNY